MNEWMKMRGF